MQLSQSPSPSLPLLLLLLLLLLTTTIVQPSAASISCYSRRSGDIIFSDSSNGAAVACAAGETQCFQSSYQSYIYAGCGNCTYSWMRSAAPYLCTDCSGSLCNTITSMRCYERFASTAAAGGTVRTCYGAKTCYWVSSDIAGGRTLHNAGCGTCPLSYGCQTCDSDLCNYGSSAVRIGASKLLLLLLLMLTLQLIAA